MNIATRASLATLALGMVVGVAGAAVAGDTLRPLRFTPGRSITVIHGSLVRGDADIYEIGGKAGQTGEIRVTSIETNAAFRIYRPPSKVVRGADGIDIEGEPLTGVDPVAGLDAGAGRHWRGTLPATGLYYLVLSGDRGNVTYELSVAIR